MQGDSGGPLVWLDPETNRYVQVALVSFGKGCRTPNPKVNTAVSYFYEWIKQVVGGNLILSQHNQDDQKSNNHNEIYAYLNKH